MSRATAIAARAALEDPASPDALLAFLTIRHPALPAPLRIVSDVMDYVQGGDTYIGIPFGFKLLSDDESVPRTQLRLSNVDRQIGQALRAMTGRAEVQLQLMSTADFDLGTDPRVEIGSAAVIYGFQHFALVNASVTATEVTGELILQDYSVEPWPNVRATQDRLPGLFR